MTKWLRTLLVLAGSAMVFPDTTAYGTEEKVREEVAVIDTNMGGTTMRFFFQESPKTVEKFKSLVRAKFFDGILFTESFPACWSREAILKLVPEASRGQGTVEPEALRRMI